MDIVEFAESVDYKSFYRNFLGHIEPEDLEVVFIYEFFEESMVKLESELGEMLPRPEINRTEARPEKYDIYLEENGLRERVGQINKNNYELYHRAVRQFTK